MLHKKLNSIRHLWAIVALCGVSLAIFWKTFVFGWLPVPGDLLVSFFFPWYSGGFSGYDSWTTSKEYLAADAIRAHIPWKKLAIDQIKQGEWPIWNPYNFFHGI